MDFKSVQPRSVRELLEVMQRIHYNSSSIEEKLDYVLNTNFDPNNIAVTSKYFYFIYDLIIQKAIKINGCYEEITGYDQSFFLNKSIENITSIIYFEDKPAFFGITYNLYSFLVTLPEKRRRKIKVSYTFRIITLQNKIKKLMLQDIPLTFDQNQNVIHKMCLISDITHLHKDNNVTVSLLDIENEESQKFAYFTSSGLLENHLEPIKITEREAEIVRLLAKGQSSKLIAYNLNVSYHTVRTHRKNLLSKFSVNNTSAIVNYALSNGLI